MKINRKLWGNYLESWELDEIEDEMLMEDL